MAIQVLPPTRPASVPETPWWWRWVVAAVVLIFALWAFALRNDLSLQLRSAIGFFCFLGLAAFFSLNLRAVSWRCIAFGVVLQLFLGLFVLKLELRDLEWLGVPDGYRPGYELFSAVGNAVKKFIDFSDEGARFVFGPLADPQIMAERFGPNNAVIVAFKVLPPIIFISSFFSVLYYFGVLQFIVRLMAKAMMYLMGTSGAETLSAAANVFMGQTEAPLIIKPYIPKMTQSEMLAMMVGGMATISGSLMAVYIEFGADPVGILATSVMAAPCGLYLSKLVYPETETPLTSGKVKIASEENAVNAIDAAAGGAADGMRLAINVAAMLIAFLALLAMANYLLGRITTGQAMRETLPHASGSDVLLTLAALAVAFSLFCWIVNQLFTRIGPRRPLHRLFGDRGILPWTANVVFLIVLFVLFFWIVDELLLFLPEDVRPLQLKHIFAALFSPVAFLMGVRMEDIFAVADLLGTKIAANEFVAYLELKNTYKDQLDPRSVVLATYALTGFANFGSVGIQIGGIGAMAPDRRSDLARLGMRALFVGFLVTVINASVAGMLSDLSE